VARWERDLGYRAGGKGEVIVREFALIMVRLWEGSLTQRRGDAKRLWEECEGRCNDSRGAHPLAREGIKKTALAGRLLG
jgi:hypothetical protein